MARNRTCTNVALTILVVLGVVHGYKLASVAGRLGERVTTGPDEARRPPPPCQEQAWWRADLAATAAPGNLLAMHRRCLVDDPTVAWGGTLHRIWGSEPGGLNIYGPEGTKGDVVELYRYVSNRLAYRQLGHPDVFSPELAQSITTRDNGRTYIIQLRRGVKWQAPDVDLGDPRYGWLRGDHELTVDDYLYLFRHMKDDGAAGRLSALRPYFATLTRAVALDRYSFELEFTDRVHSRFAHLASMEPLPHWLYAFDEDGRPIDEGTFADVFRHPWYGDRAIGTGPYRLAHRKPGDALTLDRNPDYWGEPPAFDHAQLLLIADKAAWPREFENRHLDEVHLLPNQYRTTVLEAAGGIPFGDPHVKVALNPTFGYFYVGPATTTRSSPARTIPSGPPRC